MMKWLNCLLWKIALNLSTPGRNRKERREKRRLIAKRRNEGVVIIHTPGKKKLKVYNNVQVTRKDH